MESVASPKAVSVAAEADSALGVEAGEGLSRLSWLWLTSSPVLLAALGLLGCLKAVTAAAQASRSGANQEDLSPTKEKPDAVA